MNFHSIGIRTRQDLFWFIIISGFAIMTVFLIFVLHNVPWRESSNPVLDLTPITMIVGIFGIVNSAFWAFYAVLGVVLKPKVVPSKKGNPNPYSPKVSIIIPACNEERVIGDSLRKLLKQTYSNFEIVVVSHNCSDRTFERVVKISKQSPYVRPIKYDGMAGKGAALNQGLKHVSGDLVTVFDADTQVPNDYLEKVIKYFPAYDAVQSRIETSNENYNLLTKITCLEFVSFTDRFQKVRSALGQNCTLGGTGETIKRSVLEEIGGWDNTLTEDFSLFIKLSVRGYKIGWASDAAIYDEKIPFWSNFVKQRARWMKGHYEAVMMYGLKNRNLLNLHYLLSPISTLTFYYIYFYSALFYLGFPVVTQFPPPWIWMSIWVVWQVSIAIQIAKEKGMHMLKYFPLLFLYLYHWIPVILYIPYIKTWTKTPHGFDRSIDRSKLRSKRSPR